MKTGRTRKLISFAMMFVLLICLSACGTEKKKVDISDGGDDSSPVKEEQKNTETPTPTDEPVPESLRFPLNSEHGTEWAEVESIQIGEDGKLVVVLIGEGSGFNNILQMRDGKIIIPFSAEVTVNGKTYHTDRTTLQTGKLIAHFDLGVLPDSVTFSSVDEPDKKYTASVKDGKVLQAPALVGDAGKGDDLPAGWRKEEEEFGWDDVVGKEVKYYDEKGRLRKVTDEKGGPVSDFRVEFFVTYTYTEGSPIVVFEQVFNEYKYNGPRVSVAHFILEYTMQSPDNHVELGFGWSGTAGKAADGADIAKEAECEGTEYAPDGSVVKKISKIKVKGME
ncbi:MAG: hypothetical protein J5738_03280 [Lachnospiraceae bacterium]|nr:hypothetical protein [Lachnospiraceae bacterium]